MSLCLNARASLWLPLAVKQKLLKQDFGGSFGIPLGDDGQATKIQLIA